VNADLFPNLVTKGYRECSPATRKYNCIAWAANDANRCWDDPRLGYYWPQNAPRGPHIVALRQTFEMLGYEQCLDGELEPGFEKIALYSHEDEAREYAYTHAARQLSSGLWTSKMGFEEEEDIEHVCPWGLCGKEYGALSYFMKRKIAIDVSGKEETTAS